MKYSKALVFFPAPIISSPKMCVHTCTASYYIKFIILILGINLTWINISCFSIHKMFKHQVTLSWEF